MKNRLLFCVVAAVVLLMSIPFCLASAQGETLAENQSVSFEVGAGETAQFLFIPERTGEYVFLSESESDLVGSISDEQNVLIAADDDGGTDFGFYVRCNLTKGQRYTLSLTPYFADERATGSVMIRRVVAATAVEPIVETLEMELREYSYAPIRFLPEQAEEQEFSMVSSDPSVVEAQDGGVLFALKGGEATVTVTTKSGLETQFFVRVTCPPEFKPGDVVEYSPANEQEALYTFIAPNSDDYEFYSTGEGDAYGEVYDENFELIAIGDDERDYNFSATFRAVKGKRYYLRADGYQVSGFFTLNLRRAPKLMGATFASEEYVGYVGTELYPEMLPDPIGAPMHYYEMLTSSNPNVAEIVDGVIVCRSKGKTTITGVLDDGKFASMKLEVQDSYEIKLGQYVHINTESQTETVFSFTPEVSGSYLLGSYNTDYYALYIDGLSSYVSSEYDNARCTEYQLTAGEEYFIRAQAPFDYEAYFFLYSKDEAPCVIGEHTWEAEIYRNKPTVATKGFALFICKKCYSVKTDYVDECESDRIAETDFNDVKCTDWFYESVDFAYNSNLFGGTAKRTFAPDSIMTRGMFVTVLGRLSGVSASKYVPIFSDVKKGMYYTPFVQWAYEYGIVRGVSATRFEPDTPITREQICVMILNYSYYLDVPIANDTPAAVFVDRKQISSWAKDAVKICQKAGIVRGEKTKKGYVFRPESAIIRAETATVLYTFIIKYL